MIVDNKYLIKKVESNDYELIKEIWMNDNVRKYLGGIVSEDTINDRLKSMIIDSDGIFYYSIRESESGNGIGVVSIDNYYDTGKKELSYQLLPQYWGKGIALICIEAIIVKIQNICNIDELYAETQTKNIRSINLLKKLGMEKSKELVRYGEKQSVYKMRLTTASS